MNRWMKSLDLLFKISNLRFRNIRQVFRLGCRQVNLYTDTITIIFLSFYYTTSPIISLLQIKKIRAVSHAK